MDKKHCPSVTSIYSDEAIDATSQADIPNETQHHGVAKVAHLSHDGPGKLGKSPALDGGSTAYLLSFFPSDIRAGPYGNDVAEGTLWLNDWKSLPDREVSVATIPASTPRTLSFHRPKSLKPNFCVRNAQTGEALYFAEMTSLNVPADFILHHGNEKTGSIAARLTIGQGLELHPTSTDRDHNPASNIRLHLKNTVLANRKSPIMQKKISCQAIRWKEGKVGKPWTLVNNTTMDTLAVYTKDKNKSDGRKGYLRIHHKDLVGGAEALAVLSLCAVLEEKRRRRKHRSAGWKRGGAVTSILVGSIVVFGPIFGPVIAVPLVFAGNFHHIDKYEHD